MGVFGLAQAAALTVGPDIGRRVLGTLGYPGLFVASAGTALAALACALAVPRSAFSVPASAPGVPTHRHLLRNGLSAPAIVQFTASVAYGTIISFIAVVARSRGLDVVGAFFAILALSSLGIRLVAGKAYDTWGPVAILMPLLVALAAGMTMLAVAESAPLILLAAVSAGVGIGGTHTTLISSVVDRSRPESRASSVAGFAACWELGVGSRRGHDRHGPGGRRARLSGDVPDGHRPSAAGPGGSPLAPRVGRTTSGGGHLSGPPARLPVHPPK
jgi:predicted MFS family arabinose efflux permease